MLIDLQVSLFLQSFQATTLSWDSCPPRHLLVDFQWCISVSVKLTLTQRCNELTNSNRPEELLLQSGLCQWPPEKNLMRKGISVTSSHMCMTSLCTQWCWCIVSIPFHISNGNSGLLFLLIRLDHWCKNGESEEDRWIKLKKPLLQWAFSSQLFEKSKSNVGCNDDANYPIFNRENFPSM